MIKQDIEKNSYRYERKFFISELTKHQVVSFIKLHPAMFSEIFHQRVVNNIYFDSFNLTNYIDSIEGSTYRMKVRIRWYGELFGHIGKPVFELKIKHGLLGKKESYPLSPFELNNSFNTHMVLNIISESDIPELLKMQLKCLKPILLNCYSRRYFRSANGDYRITLDTNQIFYSVHRLNNLFLNRSHDDINVILELKYNQDMDHNANSITNCFPFRLTKSSKYVTGIDRLYNVY